MTITITTRRDRMRIQERSSRFHCRSVDERRWGEGEEDSGGNGTAGRGGGGGTNPRSWHRRRRRRYSHHPLLTTMAKKTMTDAVPLFM